MDAGGGNHHCGDVCAYLDTMSSSAVQLITTPASGSIDGGDVLSVAASVAASPSEAIAITDEDGAEALLFSGSGKKKTSPW